MDEELSPTRSSLFRRFTLISTFFLVTPITLIVSLFALFTLTSTDNNQIEKDIFISPIRGAQIYASLPSDYPNVSGSVVSEDARPKLLESFMRSHNSPMVDYANTIVERSDDYGLDFRLTTAIAMKESGLGKSMPHDDCNNAWGYGIHSTGTLCFDSWEEGIETISKGLKENYADLGLNSPEEIMSKWIPHSPEGLWAVGVTYYMEEML